MQSISNWTMLGESLRDFAGNGRHEDYTLANFGGQPVSTPARFYLGGMAHLDYATGEGYYTRGDQVRSNVLTLAAGPTPPARTRAARNMYTAFGEPIASAVEAGTPSAVRSRYGFVGAFGYEGNDTSQVAGFDVLAEAGFLHVGARHYDPASGRLLERDPLGIRGGTNVYAYVNNSPLSWIDPDGRTWVGTTGTWMMGGGAVIGGVGGAMFLAAGSGAAVGAVGAVVVGAGALLWMGDQVYVIFTKPPPPPPPYVPHAWTPEEIERVKEVCPYIEDFLDPPTPCWPIDNDFQVDPLVEPTYA